MALNWKQPFQMQRAAKTHMYCFQVNAQMDPKSVSDAVRCDMEANGKIICFRLFSRLLLTVR